MVLFGAPLTTHTPQTILTALHLSLLASYPLFSSIIPTTENLRQLVTLEYSPDMDVQKWAYWGALGTCIGAWLGAVPIPLDWDREWQVSPLEINSDVVEMADYDHCGGVYWTCSWISCGDGVCGNK
jgi:phosphatidylinositol glycan class F